MRRATISLLLLATIPAIRLAQTPSPSRPQQRLNPDRLGMTCVQILEMKSAEWIADFNDKAHVAAPEAAATVLRAAAVYGKCYDARTDRLAAALARSGKGPSREARADFARFEAALEDFGAKALADASVPADDTKRAYAALYEKQFRYDFYEEYEAKTVKAVKPVPSPVKPPAPPASTTTSAVQPPAATGPATPNVTASAARGATTAQERARSDADPVTLAKNRFGKLLEVLPEDKMHELHRAFGDVIGPHPISEATRLAIYRYAIFLLESPSATPPSEPPF
jgi:hypothetical protein